MDYTVGELARRVGLTVRALHHYEKLGLLRPSGRSEAGYRRYGATDVLRLHRLLALRDAGLALKDIAPLLDGEAPRPLAEVLREQIAQLESRLLEQQQLLQTLRAAERNLLRLGAEGDAIAVLLDAMALRRIKERHFSPDQLRALNRHWDALPEAEREAAQQAWPQLLEQARRAMEQGLEPGSAPVQALLDRWLALQQSFMAIHPGLRDTVRRMYEQEPELRRQAGGSPELVAYLRQAREGRGAANHDPS